MVKCVNKCVLAVALASGLTGCVLAPQTIELSQQYDIADAGVVMPQRDALVRVVDNRNDFSGDQIGHRGGRLPENSPLNIQDELKEVLTQRLQSSMAQLGFGGSSPLPPLKVQLDINTFGFTCNEGVIVNECSLEFSFLMTVMAENATFTKPYSVTESRGLAVSPTQEYNQQWVNEALDKVWARMFSDAELRQALNVR